MQYQFSIVNSFCYSFFPSDLAQSLTKYCSSHEDVLEWLLDVEDRLEAMGNVSENLDQIKIQFQVHGDYMQYLDSNQEEIGKVTNSCDPPLINFKIMKYLIKRC